MPYGNATILAGNLTRDIELKTSQAGKPYAQGGLAVSKGKDQQAAFFDFTIFGDLAENATESFSKGDRVLIEGRLDQSSWTNNEGKKQYKVSIIVDDIAASVRWSTVTVHRTPRGGSRPAPDEKWDGPAEDAF